MHVSAPIASMNKACAPRDPRTNAPSADALPAPGPLLTVRAAFRQVFPGVMVAMFLAVAEQTILASALPTIASDLGGFEDLSWIVVAYLLAATIAAPLYGHLGDHFGRKRMLLVALAVFTIASAACAAAPTFFTLIAARAVQGLGGGGLMTLAQSLIGENVPPRERGRFQGYFAAVFALASTSAPILGAYLTEHVSWRAIFVVNLPLGLLAAIFALRIPYALPPQRGKYTPDIIGTALFTLATLGLLYALASAGHRLPFDSWRLYALLAIVAAAYAALNRWEQRSEQPVLPVHLLRMPAIARSNAVAICFAATSFATILYLPLYLQIGRGLGIGTSGTLLLPLTLSMVTGAMVVGRLISATGKVTVFPLAGLSLATAALVALGATIGVARTPLVLCLTALIGAGLGTVMPSMQVIIQHAAGRESLGAAIGSLSLSRSIGGAIGVAIIGATVFVLVGSSGDGSAATLQYVMQAGPRYLGQLSEAERSAVVTQLDDTFRAVFFGIAAMSGIGAVIAASVPKPKL
jgi:EmrB/QacA subfamily drug resistance transporter